MTATPTPLVPGRSCAECALCCKILEIRALEKPAGQWCGFCSTRQGCDAYDTRPDTCRRFHCGYLTNASIPDHWRPAASRMMITFANPEEGSHIFVHVDSGRADAWKKAPYYNDLKSWARQFNPRGMQIMVKIANRYIVVTPERDIDIGPVASDETVTFTRRQTPQGVVMDVAKSKIENPQQ